MDDIVRDRLRLVVCPPRETGGLVGLVLVERLGIEETFRESVEVLAVDAERLDRVAVALVDDAAHLDVDNLTRRRRGAVAVEGELLLARWRERGDRADRGDIPQRPTIWRAIVVARSRSDSAPVVKSSNTSSSAARPLRAPVIRPRR